MGYKEESAGADGVALAGTSQSTVWTQTCAFVPRSLETE